MQPTASQTMGISSHCDDAHRRGLDPFCCLLSLLAARNRNCRLWGYSDCRLHYGHKRSHRGATQVVTLRPFRCSLQLTLLGSYILSSTTRSGIEPLRMHPGEPTLALCLFSRLFLPFLPPNYVGEDIYRLHPHAACRSKLDRSDALPFPDQEREQRSHSYGKAYLCRRSARHYRR